MKKIIIIVGIIVIIGVLFLVFSGFSRTITTDPNADMQNGMNNGFPTGEDENNMQDDENMAETTRGESTVIGQSVEGRDITAYHFGNVENGDTELLFIGGIHGGYSWNTALVAYEAMAYFEQNAEDIPDNVAVTVIPVLNPDGLYKVVGKTENFSSSDVSDNTAEGRVNAHDVDLNRNFDCEWNEEGTWQNKTVSGGSQPFSEPESQAIRDYVNQYNPSAVVVWYSAAGGVFASNCRGGVLDETREITKLYADASGYRAYEEFNFYDITGDMVNWLAKENIPGISVLLTSHNSTEWSKNRAGIEALLNHYK